MEVVENQNHVCHESGLEGPLTLEGLETYSKLSKGPSEEQIVDLASFILTIDTL
jgi:hypothetical protein